MGIVNLQDNDVTGNKNMLIEKKEVDRDKEVVENEDPTSTGEESDKKIVLDGPLGHIYTKALNLIYANEGLNLMSESVLTDDEETAADGSSLYVYTVDGDNLDHSGLLEATNKLSNSRQQSKLLVLEGISSNSKAGLLERYATGLGIKVYVSRESSLNAIVNFR